MGEVYILGARGSGFGTAGVDRVSREASDRASDASESLEAELAAPKLV
jgi:hypothetical protein